MDASDRRRIIVGIDFGTTFTGIGWAESERNNGQQVLINDWPSSRESQGGSSSPKAPTKLRYLDSGEIEWGFQIPDDAQPRDILSLFKLGLEIDRYRNSVDVIGKSLDFDNVDQNITDYLAGVFEYFMKVMQRQIGNGLLHNSTLHFVLTVPAIWGEAARQRTTKAFERIPNLPKDHLTTLFSEPEAAATAALRDLNNHDLRVNDSFVVVDAGGGTVDLITYTITSLFPGLEVAEATEGTGDFCGSSRLNDRFIQFLTSRLGREDGWDDEVLHGAVENFEGDVKRKFDMSALARNREFYVPVPGLGLNPDVGIHRTGRLTLKADEVHLFFEPDMIKIIQLVKDQIAMAAVPIQKILLVGGYGASIYLRERIQVAVREDSSIVNEIEVLQPPNSWASIVRGAVMKGLSLANPVNYDVPIVKTRTARKHYGYSCGRPFDPRKHESLRSRKYWDGLTGCWRVKVMDWIIKRGEPVSENEPFLRTYYHAQPVVLGRPNSITSNIYSDQVSSVAPLSKDKNVKLLCRVTANLHHIPENELEKTLGVDEMMYYQLEYQIESIYQSASTEYTLIYKGKYSSPPEVFSPLLTVPLGQRHGTVTAEYV
ncbi:uncharacterized protein F4807DRAFT_459977 [Annulohypoxylon truncatum]|uniref:uncharacterized protein n=1 Tax=Annulohypoxylon truncatum TaxID=327061 RepID=UPI002007BA26|nr:uncharacterized protein F4807DRAFT_459977 [Annulohypoxylon truncatum]KAI1210146.1 hypothetical protein F4807DRAFT_459977 [Annulohypoxylon truncatum]